MQKEIKEIVRNELALCRKNEIKTSADKVTELRKRLNLSQAELSGDRINRTLVSYVENKKIGLTKKTAEAITANINELMEARGASERVLLSDIFVDMNEEILKITKTFEEKLHKMTKEHLPMTDEFITEIEEFLFDKSIPYDKAKIYEQIANIYSATESEHSEIGYIYYTKAFEFYILANEVDHLDVIILKLLQNRLAAKEFSTMDRYATLYLCTIQDGITKLGIKKMRTGNKETLASVYLHWAKAKYEFGNTTLAISLTEIALNYTPATNLFLKAKILGDMGYYISKDGDYTKGAKCIDIALKRFVENQSFIEYCDTLTTELDLIIEHDLLSPDDKAYKLDRLATNMLYALKYLPESTDNLYRYHLCLCNIYDIQSKIEELSNHFSLAMVHTLEMKNARALVTLILEINTLSNKEQLFKSINVEQVIEKLYASTQNSSDYNKAVFILIAILARQGEYTRLLKIADMTNSQ